MLATFADVAHQGIQLSVYIVMGNKLGPILMLLVKTPDGIGVA